MDTKEFRDKLFSGRMTRREVNKALASVGVAMATVPLASTVAKAADPEGQPTFYTWGGWDLPEFFDAYLEKHGELPNMSLFADEEEAFAKMRAGFAPDAMYPCSYELFRWYDAGFLGPIDTSKLSNWPDVIPALLNIDGDTRDGERVFVPLSWGLTSVLFRTDLAPEYVDPAKHTWGILWDEKYKGKMAMIDSLIDGVAVAAIYAGIDPFTMGDKEIAEVREIMRRQLPLLRFYSNDMTTIEQALASGELVAAVTWNSSVVALKKEGLPVLYMNPKEGPMTWVCGATIFKGTPYVDKAHDVIDALLDPRSRLYDMLEYGYGGSNLRAFEMTDEAKLAEVGLPKDPGPYLESGIFQIEMKNKEKIQAMFEEVKAGM